MNDMSLKVLYASLTNQANEVISESFSFQWRKTGKSKLIYESQLKGLFMTTSLINVKKYQLRKNDEASKNPFLSFY